ncbi:protein FAR1-RELATED SEQUENCE 5-like [Salvia miltiorrhiza]|uniref:protein FAR1-RELATED SEQUENCE 5-like n=1 Tax=Salvia miltiorrhiza TaxID=226208 RepID=UPI0025ABB7A6|nr:protein FAR1-RELATED SEQUENCE 5-like [Salvia miltiorrhiza]
MNIDLNNSYATETFGESFSGDVNSRGSEEGDPHGYIDSLFDRNADDDVEGDADADTETKICESQDNPNDGIDSFESLKKSFEMRLVVGTEIDILHAVHKLYCDYAAVMGFSVRKGNQEYFNPTDDVRMKMYHCSCAGTADNKSSKGRIAAYKKQSYRSNCDAKLRADLLLRSARNMSRQKKRLLISMRASGIGVSKAYRFLEDEAGGRENIGFIRKDVYNELNSENRNMSKVDNGDANKLLDILTDRGMSDPSFFWKVKLSDDGRLENLFFRDTRCLIDYQHFGDVLSVDATYKTNKYDLICIPLIGINHH